MNEKDMLHSRIDVTCSIARDGVVTLEALRLMIARMAHDGAISLEAALRLSTEITATTTRWEALMGSVEA